MTRDNPLKRIAVGALAGLAGTVAIGVLRALGDRFMPAASPPIEKDPAEFMVDKAARLLPRHANRHISEGVEHAAAKSLAFGYGMTFGALYGGLRPRERRPVAADGALVGVATWAVG